MQEQKETLYPELDVKTLMKGTLRDLVDSFELHKTRTALMSFNSRESEKFSYAFLLEDVRRVAGALKTLGLKKGDRAVFFAANTTGWITCCLGAIYGGLEVVPIDSQHADEAVAHILDDASANIIFTDKKGGERLKSIVGKKASRLTYYVDKKDGSDSWLQLTAMPGAPVKSLPALAPDDIAIIFYTSGTTGMPKGVPLTHSNILLQQKAAIVESGLLRPQDVVLMPLPLFHVYPLNIGLIGPLLLGITVVLPRALTGPEISRAIKEGKVTVFIGVPRLLRSLYESIELKFHKNKLVGAGYEATLAVSSLWHKLTGKSPGRSIFGAVHEKLGPTLRLFTSGGAPLKPELAQKFIGLGYDIAVGYGLSETAPLLTMRLPEDKNLATVGKPIEGVEIKIGFLPAADRKNGEGEIQARGPNVFSGYLNLPEKNEEAFTQDGWFRTGDLGKMEGGELVVTGRASSTIVMEGGEKIQPDDIEERLAKESDAIAEVALLQKNHKLVALAVPEKGKSRDDVGAALKAGLRGRASYLQITDFAIAQDSLPKTNLGKVKRHELEKAYDEAAKAGKSGSKSKNTDGATSEDRTLLADENARKTYEWLKGHFKGQLITLDTSPQSDLGIDSLDWLTLTIELSERVGIELNQDAIGRIETVRDLLREASQASEAGEDDRGKPTENPELFLTDEEMQYVQIPTGRRARFRKTIYDLICFLMLPFRVKAYGLENVPEDQAVFCPNHSSYLDSFAIGAVLPYQRLIHTQWAGWTGLAYANAISSYLSRLSGIIPIEGNKSLVTSLALGAMVLQKGHHLVWYPEGTRSEDGRLLEFKQGLGLILEQHDVPIVPVYIKGARKALPPGVYIPRPHRIEVFFGEPIKPDELIKEGKGDTTAAKLVDGLHARVQALMDEHGTEYDAVRKLPANMRKSPPAKNAEAKSGDEPAAAKRAS